MRVNVKDKIQFWNQRQIILFCYHALPTTCSLPAAKSAQNQLNTFFLHQTDQSRSPPFLAGKTPTQRRPASFISWCRFFQGVEKKHSRLNNRLAKRRCLEKKFICLLSHHQPIPRCERRIRRYFRRSYKNLPRRALSGW